MRVIDVSNTSAPLETALLEVGDTAWDVAVSGNFAYLADGLAGLRILDISDPANP
ncbi:MAG: hypothetical protein KDG51_11590, partial [Calditrichaeota bacterium]|nr:hypothetical protein [Calditrichota bacterium]